MKLSESIRRGTFDSFVGGIINKFKIKSRRTTLFFEEILTEYIKLCEDNGHSEEIENIGRKWGSLGTKQLAKLKMFQSLRLLSSVMTAVWSNIGLMDELRATRDGDVITFDTKNEFITRIIGRNSFMIGFFSGGIISYFGLKTELLDFSTDRYKARYRFRVMGKQAPFENKDKETYNKMNSIYVKTGKSFRDSLKSRLFTLKGNRIYFRGKSVIPVENTVFHIMGNHGIMIDSVVEISCEMFSDVVIKGTETDKKLLLLKNLFQSMGWCTVKIIRSGDSVVMNLSSLPVGLQREKDNWEFLSNVFFGFVKAIDKRAVMKSRETRNNNMRIVFKLGGDGK